MSVGQAGIPAEPAPGDLEGGLELAPAPQRFAQLQEGKAGRLIGQPRRQTCGCHQSR